ncbi:porin [Photobacterium sanguinicancri]|uniref:porin n=1 Tax=Photobacterium sanguinicancri TaxID=875932 RepID=UPI0024811334|nr:porin [Photobacterium sanguinicancri]
MNIKTANKTALAVCISTLLASTSLQAANIYQNENGDNLNLYGEVGVGGHFGANFEYGEFFKDQAYIDDSFATLGVKGKNGQLVYRLELDFERENWKYGSGDMVLSIDKMFIGYALNDYHYVEFGLTDTAFDDYDKWGDFTFDTTVETGEAGDQDATVKYEGTYGSFKLGTSYSYNAKSSSGSLLGDVVNGYFGYFGSRFSAVVGLEGRGGAEGESKYGKQKLAGLGMRFAVTDNFHLGFNGYIEDEDIAQTKIPTDITDPNNSVHLYNDYQTLYRKGALISGKYEFTPQWEMTGSANYEAYEEWDKDSEFWDTKEHSWGSSRTWGTLGVNFKPTPSSIIALEANAGDAAQDVYAYTRIYF